jgi:hypothetical protein
VDPQTLQLLLSLGGGALGSFFGPQQGQLPPELEHLFRQFMRMGREDLRTSRGIPGSSPQEQAVRAQATGLLGQQQRGQQEQLASTLGGPLSSNFANAPDAMSRFDTASQGQYGGLLGQLFQMFMQQRSQARDRAASEFGQAGQFASGPRMPTDPGLGGALGQAASAWAMQQGMKGTGGAGISPAAGRLGGTISSPASPGPNWLSGGSGMASERSSAGPNWLQGGIGGSGTTAPSALGGRAPGYTPTLDEYQKQLMRF